MHTRGKNWRAYVLAVVCVLAIASNAQSFDSPKPGPSDSISTVVVDVDVVNVFFNVRDHDQPVRELKPEDFQLYEDRRPQSIRYFSAESQQPLTLAILVDSSSSQTNVLSKQTEVGRRFLQQVLTPADEALVVGFDSRVQMHQDFTQSHDNLIAALARGSQGTTGSTTAFDSLPVPLTRSTALYDAIVGTSKHRMSTRSGHKAMLILTDGQDMGSRQTAKQAIEAAQRADTICYVLLIGDKNEMASAAYQGIQRMKELTHETGGRMILVGGDMKKLEHSFNEISDELRHFYSLAYTSDRKEKKGEYRAIQLKSRHGYKVQARKGYYAVPPPKPAMAEALY